MQLGFPDLLVQTASTECAELLRTLVAHLDSLQGLLELHTRTASADTVRIGYLRQLLRDGVPGPVQPLQFGAACDDQAHPPPTVAFSQFASTVRALHRALGDMPALRHSRRKAAGLPAAIFARRTDCTIAPRANGRPPRDQEIA